MGVRMVAANKQVLDSKDDSFDLGERIKELDKSLEKFNEISLSLPYNNEETDLEDKPMDLNVKDVEEEMESLVDNVHDDGELSQSMINETGSCPDVEKNDSCSGWYGLIPEDDSIYQVQYPTFSELDESLDTQVQSRPNIFISQSKTPARAKPKTIRKSFVKKHQRRGSIATSGKQRSTETLDNNYLVQTWLDTKFDKKPHVKKSPVPRGMLAKDDSKDVMPQDTGGFQRKIHPKYATFTEKRPVTPPNEIVEGMNEDTVEKIVKSTSRKRKRDVEPEDNEEILPSKRTRTERWQWWVSRFMPKWISGIFGFHK